MTKPQAAQTPSRSGARWMARLPAVVAILGPGLILMVLATVALGVAAVARG